MTTVPHLDLENDWSRLPFFTLQIACIQGVRWSLRCCCLLLDWVVRPSIGLCSKPFLQVQLRCAIVPFQRCSVKFFHIGLRVSLFVHAHLILLIIEVALHDRSTMVLLREI